MEELFFAIHQVWWTTPILGLSIITALIGGVCIGGSIAYKNQKKIRKVVRREQQYIFHPIDAIDSKYAEKTLIEIRRYLTYRYNPVHSWAHIPYDIQAYITDNDLNIIIEQLEAIEYSGKAIEKNIIESINKELVRKLQA